MDDGGTPRRAPDSVLYLVISGAPAPEGVPALITACQAAGWRVVVFSTPTGTRFVDASELEKVTGEPVRSEYRMPGTGMPVPPADAVLACPLTFNSVNKFAHGHADNFAIGLLCEMVGYEIPVVIVPHCKPQLATLQRAMRAPSLERLSVYGALHLAAAATAAAACYDRAITEPLLATARAIADRTGEVNHMGTAFGPVNVAIHAISASLRLGDPRTAAETGEALDATAMPVGLVGRRTQVNLDLARAYTMCRKDAAAVNLLLAAERLSPQLVRHDQATRDVFTELLRREHRPSTPELRPLAHRAGVI